MKVAVIIPALKQVGPIKVVESLVNSLSLYNNVHLEVFHLDKFIDSGIRINVPLRIMNVRSFEFEYYDIIHTHGIRPDLIAFWNRKRIKYHISTIHNFVFADLRYTYNRFISVLFGLVWLVLWKRADKLVCVSQSLKKYYERWFSSDKLAVIHNGINYANNCVIPDDDIVMFINESRSRGLKILGTACNLTKRKGLDQVLDLMAFDQQYAFVVIGKGKSSDNLIRQSHKLNISDRCYFTGFRDSAVNYFKLFDIFIMPSRSEGFCLALTEAINEQVPAVCSDINVFQELFTSNEVFFFKSDSMDSLKRALKEAANNGYGKINAASERVKRDYDSKLMATRYFDLYKLSVS